jgi:hypothetical protein
MRLLIIILLLAGFTMMIQGILKSGMTCPPPKIVYRYVPRTFKEEQDMPVPMESIYGKMFAEKDAWQKISGY